MVKRQFIATEL